MAGFRISLDYHAPQGFWTAESSREGMRLNRAGGLFTSAEAALAAMWLTIDERIQLPAISTYAQVRELLDRRSAGPMDSTDTCEVEDLESVVSQDIPADSPEIIDVTVIR
jgi:hypothetical protein